MSKSNLGLYLTDSYLYLCAKDQVYQEKIDANIIVDNKIAKSEEFYRYLLKIIKKHKLNDSLLGKNILIVEQPNYQKVDKELLTSIFEKLSFNKINFYQYNNLLDNDNTFNLNQHNALIWLNKQNYYFSYNMFINNDENNLTYFLKHYVDNNDIFLIGDLANLNNIAQRLEQECKINIYRYNQPQLYIINKLQKIIV